MTEPPSTDLPAPVTRVTAVPPAKGWTMFEENGQDEVGVVVDQRFEILARIGDGGMARVYACKDLVLGSVAALKVCKGNNPDTRRRFAEEALLLANVHHPHLVGVLMTGKTEDGAPYMVLEYLPGRSLDERLRDDGPVPWREVVQIATQVARALEVLHRLGVIHRDVKPSNIMQLDSATGQPVVKLLDLGIAKVHDWQRVQAAGFTAPPRHQTDVGKVLGTPGFYPPEGGHVPAGPRFDVFGVGVTIYQLCTGELPDLVNPRPMRLVRPDCEVPPELDAVVMAAITVLPDDRIATIEALRVRLEAISTESREGGSSLFAGCFELLEVLGVGAKAEVYRAYHRDAGQYMALKVLSATARESPDERARFAREARVLWALHDAAIPRVYECRTADQTRMPYIAMSMARGRRASEFCTEVTRLPPADVVAVGRQLASALVAAHTLGILHRDINTTNVLIDLGRSTTATLVDFGMTDLESKFYAVVDQRYPTPPEARGTLGTGGLEHLEWTAPEARSGKGWTAASDVYSLALLLYRLLTGKRPTRGKSIELIDPRDVVRDCPPELAQALLAGLHADPASRLNAAQLRDRLADVAEELSGSDEGEDESEVRAQQAPVDTHVAPLEPMTTRVAAPDLPTPGRGRARRPVAAWAATAVAAVTVVAVVGWWTGAAESPAAEVMTLPTPTTFGTVPAAVSAPAPAFHAKPATVIAAVPAGSAADLLTAADPALTECARKAGRKVWVELKISKGEPRFTTLDIIGDDTEGCARRVLEQIQFAPPDRAGALVKEYEP